MEEAIAIADRHRCVHADDLLAIQATLMAGDERPRSGKIREEQNWIGGRLGNPSEAFFVPPPEDLVGALLEDLVAFMARDDLPAVAQAAVAHAQLGIIHPFIGLTAFREGRVAEWVASFSGTATAAASASIDLADQAPARVRGRLLRFARFPRGPVLP
jgi:hypothetical protein